MRPRTAYTSGGQTLAMETRLSCVRAHSGCILATEHCAGPQAIRNGRLSRSSNVHARTRHRSLVLAILSLEELHADAVKFADAVPRAGVFEQIILRGLGRRPRFCELAQRAPSRCQSTAVACCPGTLTTGAGCRAQWHCWLRVQTVTNVRSGAYPAGVVRHGGGGDGAYFSSVRVFRRPRRSPQGRDGRTRNGVYKARKGTRTVL